MIRMCALIGTAVLLAGIVSAQHRSPGACCGAGQAPIAGSPVVELKGKVVRVQITPGGGMPFVEIRTANQVAKVHLGSMRYMMAEGFNPKVDEEIVAKVYKLDTGFVAISVFLPAQKKTVRFRDEHGWPLWRGGRRD